MDTCNSRLLPIHKVQTCVGDKNVRLLTIVYLLPSTTDHEQIFTTVRWEVNCYPCCITETHSWCLYSWHLCTQISYILYECLDMKVCTINKNRLVSIRRGKVCYQSTKVQTCIGDELSTAASNSMLTVIDHTA